MNTNLQTDLWFIRDKGFVANYQQDVEQKFILSNGLITQRSHFEEFCSTESEIGTFVKGIYSFKNECKQLSLLPDWTSLNIRLNAEQLDLASCEIIQFNRTIDMFHGILERNFEIVTAEKHHIEVSVQRFLSLHNPEIAAIKYAVKSVNFAGRISFLPVIDGAFNIEEPEWNVLQSKTQKDVAHLWIQTRKTNLQVCEAMSYDLFKNNAQIKYNPTKIEKQKVAGFSLGTDIKEGDSVCVYKFASILNSNDHPYQELTNLACEKALSAKLTGWNELLEEHIQAWAASWETLTNQTGKELLKEEIINKFQQNQLLYK